MTATVLVIGRKGQVATSLAEAARTADLSVTVLGRPEIDLADPSSIHTAIAGCGADVVVNAAAYTAVDKAESERDLTFAINADGVKHLAEACAQTGRPLIHISTDYVFDGTAPGPYAEDDPVAPLGVYGASKLAGEDFVRAACPNHVILRTAWVVSPFGHNFVKTMLRLAETREELGVVDDQRGSPTYAPHLADAILGIAAQVADGSGDGPWGTYNAAGTGEATWCDVAREVFEHSARLGGPSATVRPITTADYPTPAQRPANSRLDCSRMAATFGISLPDWRQGIEECVLRLRAEDQAGTADAAAAGGKA